MLFRKERGDEIRPPEAWEIDGDRKKVGDDERDPDERRVVLEPPRVAGSKKVPPLAADDPKSARGEENDVRGEQNADAQCTIVHR